MAGSLDLQRFSSKSNDINAFKLYVCLITKPSNSKIHSNTFNWLEKRKSWSCQRQVCAQMGCWPEGWGSHTRPLCFLNLYLHNWQTCQENTGKSTWSSLIFCCKSCKFCNHSLEYEGDDYDHFLVAMLMMMAWMCFLSLFAQLVHFALPARRGPLRAFVNKLTPEKCKGCPGKKTYFYDDGEDLESRSR